MASETIITYDQIVIFCERVNKSTQIKVLLSRYQAWLFRKKLESMSQKMIKQSSIARILNVILFALIQLLTLFTCPKLAFLADYYDFDDSILKRVTFEKHEDGMLVTFLPRQKKRE